MSAVLNLLIPLSSEVTELRYLLAHKSIFRIILARDGGYLEIHLKQEYNRVLDVALGLSAIQAHIEYNYRNNLITEEDFLILRDFIKSELMPVINWAFPQIQTEEEIPNIQSRW